VENLVLLANAVQATGNAAANALTGNAAANRLHGLAGNDILDGFSGDDVLRGGGSRDIAAGGDGDDVIIGGRGGDTLTGGADNDSFVFRSVSDSGVTDASRDIINDFTSGDDIIDLSGIDARAANGGNQAFIFIGAAAFTASGQLRLNTTSPQPMLEGDVTGDGVADFQIVLNGVTTVTAADLIL
jgi:serralysin